MIQRRKQGAAMGVAEAGMAEWEAGKDNYSPDCCAMYVKEIGSLGLLTHDDEVALAKAIETGKKAKERLAILGSGDEERSRLEAEVERGNEARRKFIESNLRLVFSIAKRFADRGLPLEDLIQEGNVGLFRAVEKFDYHKGWRFSTYALWWIRQAVTRALIDQSRTIRLPVHVSEMVSRIMKVSEGLQQDLGHEPTTEELARALGVSVETLRVALRATQKPISLDLSVGEDDDGYLGDLVEDHFAVAPPEAVGKEMLSREVRAMLNDLSDRERKVVALRYGIGTNEALTLDEVGATLGVTRERVRQIEKGAMAKLARWSRKNYLQDYLAN